jgi:hypothetical protein
VLHAPAVTGAKGMSIKISEKYRFKALVSEKLSRDAADGDIKAAWSDIAIEWHTLAFRAAEHPGQNCEIEYS